MMIMYGGFIILTFFLIFFVVQLILTLLIFEKEMNILLHCVKKYIHFLVLLKINLVKMLKSQLKSQRKEN